MDREFDINDVSIAILIILGSIVVVIIIIKLIFASPNPNPPGDIYSTIVPLSSIITQSTTQLPIFPIEILSLSPSYLNKIIMVAKNHYQFIEACSCQSKTYPNSLISYEMIILALPKQSQIILGLAPFGFSNESIPGLVEGTIAVNISEGTLCQNGIATVLNKNLNMKIGDRVNFIIQCQPTVPLQYKILLSINEIQLTPIEWSSYFYLTFTLHATTGFAFQINLPAAQIIPSPLYSN